jgi:hypothetical protein
MITGNNITAYQYTVQAKALELWAKHRIKANRNFSPKQTVAHAARISGKNIKPLDYLGAAKALRAAAENITRNGASS